MRLAYLTVLTLCSCCSATGSLVISATSSCQVKDSLSGNILFTDTHNETLSSSTGISGLDCSTPYGLISFPNSSVIYSIGPTGVFQVALSGNVLLQSASITQYLLFGSLDLSLSGQQTYIATGGSGGGVIKGMAAGDSDFSGEGSVTTLTITTPFGSCTFCGHGSPTNYQYSFVFGQPFTLAVTGHLANSVGFGNDLSSSSNVMVGGASLGVFDVGGNLISATFTPVPEPNTLALFGGALVWFLLPGLWPRRFTRRLLR